MAALISNWLAPFSTPLERYILVVHQIPCFVRLLKLFLPACLRGASYFRFINIASENQIIHVGYGGDSGSVIECVAHYDGVTGFTGIIKINPSIVDRIRVLLNEALFLVIPSLTISGLSLAVCNSSRCLFYGYFTLSYSSLPISLLSNSFFIRAKSVSPCLALISASLANGFCRV